jgi:hypothetical protein
MMSTFVCHQLGNLASPCCASFPKVYEPQQHLYIPLPSARSLVLVMRLQISGAPNHTRTGELLETMHDADFMGDTLCTTTSDSLVSPTRGFQSHFKSWNNGMVRGWLRSGGCH